MERSSLAIIIPAFNEAATIAGVLSKVSPYGNPIVVDDGSGDETGELAGRCGAHVVRHSGNRGYDEALNSGFAKAAALGFRHVITMDADGQHGVDQLGLMIQQLETGFKLVLGVRNNLPRIGEAIFASCAARAWRINDPLCGMKAYAMDLYEKAGCFDSCKSIGCELAVRSVSQGCRFAQVPIMTHKRLDAPRFGRSFKANCKILRAMAVMLYRYAPSN
jgi:glycosyltransferase involved in cell wall biosynthesis